MRHLLAVVDPRTLMIGEPDAAIVTFGQKYGLTSTEIEILDGLLQGQTPSALAENTGRTYGTVRWHVQNILEKCQVNSQKGLLSEFYRLIRQ